MTKEDTSYEGVRNRALKLLSRREHTEVELGSKLSRGGPPSDIVLAVIGDLKRENYLSDERFAEVFVRSRRERGDGPLKIRHELKAKGVSDAIVRCLVDPADDTWEAVLQTLWDRKFGTEPADYAEWAKQARFLQSRGFTVEQIKKLVSIRESS